MSEMKLLFTATNPKSKAAAESAGRAARVIEILKSQSHYVDGKCRWQFTTTGVQSKTVGAELLGQLPPGGAEGVAKWGFHNHAGSVLVGRIGNLQVKVAISSIEPCKLQEGLADMEYLQLPPLARGIKGRLCKYRPTQDRAHRDLLGGNLWQGYMLGVRPKVAAPRLGIRAYA